MLIVASGACPENMFSRAKIITHERRSRLGAENVDAILLFEHWNRKFGVLPPLI